MASGRVPFDGARLDDAAPRPPAVPAWQVSLRHELGRLRSSRRRVIARFDATRQLATPHEEGTAESWDRYVDTQVRNLTSEAVISSIGDTLDQAFAILDTSAKAPAARRLFHAGWVYEAALGCLHRGRESLYLVEDDAWVGAQLATLRAGVATTMGPDDPRTESYLRYLDDLTRSVADGPRPEPGRLGGARTTASGAVIAPVPIAPVTGPVPTAAQSVSAAAGPTFGPAVREALRAIQTAVDDARMAAQIAVRAYRNALVAAIGLLSVAAVAFPVVAGTLGQTSVRMSQAASADPSAVTQAQFTTSYLAGVEVWGLLGSLVAVIAGLWRLRSSRQPSGLAIAQLVLKLPAGALTAVFGVLLLQGGIVLQLQPAQLGQIPAYAILFGFAQEGLTRFVDGKANTLLENAKPLSDRTG